MLYRIKILICSLNKSFQNTGPAFELWKKDNIFTFFIVAFYIID